MSSARRKYWAPLLIVLFCAWLAWYVKLAGHHMPLQYSKMKSDFWGITYSKKYAQELELDWREAYTALLEDVGVSFVRLPIYWDDVEPEKDIFNYDDYDWMLDEGERHGVKFTVVLGRRLPRWPECHQPAWTDALSEDEINKRHLIATYTAIQHFKGRPEIQYWQLENEYFLPWFGLCPKANLDLLKKEIEMLRSEDNRPIVLTESGEFNSWRHAAQYSDILGITMYRVVWNKYFYYMRMPWPAWLYRMKALAIGRKPEAAIIAELQAEPWPSSYRGVTDIDKRESEKSFDLQQFETNSELARRSGFSQAYYWGAEWWYWLKVHGDASMWEKAKSIIRYGRIQEQQE